LTGESGRYLATSVNNNVAASLSKDDVIDDSIFIYLYTNVVSEGPVDRFHVLE